MLPLVALMVLREIDHRRACFTKVDSEHEKRCHNAESHMLAKASSTLAIGRHVWLGSIPNIICISLWNK